MHLFWDGWCCEPVRKTTIGDPSCLGTPPNVLQHLFCRCFIRPGFLFYLRSSRLG
jgi:hypothetical protein